MIVTNRLGLYERLADLNYVTFYSEYRTTA